MIEFLVRYEVTHTGKNGYGELASKDSYHALIINANDVKDAFVAAYDHLSRLGYAVSTKFRSTYDSVEQNYFDLNDQDIEDIWKRGVPVNNDGNNFKYDTSIISISAHKLVHGGSVVTIGK